LLPHAFWDQHILRLSSFEHGCALTTLSLSLLTSKSMSLAKKILNIASFAIRAQVCTHGSFLDSAKLTLKEPSKKSLNTSVDVWVHEYTYIVFLVFACLESLRLQNCPGSPVLAKCFILVKNLKL